jgi:L-alanine-DL-glutamate epimerase-like enolase superfamily enzyme
MATELGVESVETAVFRIPTDAAEADGTLAWDSTTMLVVHVVAAGLRGMGYSYTTGAAAKVIHDVLEPQVLGCSVMDVPAQWRRMRAAVRNLGFDGVCATAISAVDVALWDLKARHLGVSTLDLLGAARERVAVYGSGGFVTYDDQRLASQLAGWAAAGAGAVKMKIGEGRRRDRERARIARDAIGPQTQLFVDANGAYDAREALAIAGELQELDVRWFEEPVSSDQVADLAWIRERAPPGMAVAAGEYGYGIHGFRRLLEARAVDVMQIDATRCGGYTGFLQAESLARAFGLPTSAHCAPALHAPLCCAAPSARHVEYFHDHVRIESLLFDAVSPLADGMLQPDRGRPGTGLQLRARDAEAFRA